MDAYDVIVVGAGPAGLSAALILGRCRRRILVCDHGLPRNRKSHRLNGYLGSEGSSPKGFLRAGREQLRAYDVKILKREVLAIREQPSKGRFEARLAGGQRFRARKILLTTGLRDILPPIRGIERFYGRSVFHCPYCDGWENRAGQIAVYGKADRGFDLALSMLGWSSSVALCSDGPSRLRPLQRRKLRRLGVAVFEDRIEGIEGAGGRIRALSFAGRKQLPCSALFFNTGSFQNSPLCAQLGCRFDSKGGILVRKYQIAGRPGVYAAGNILRDVQLSIVAAAEGASAAFAINSALLKEDL